MTTLLQNAEKFCFEHKHRFTDSRRAVLKIVAEAGKPLGAYDILEGLKAYMDNPKPPTAYRAIEFWQRHGFVHRIESLNAYVTCHAGHLHHGSQYMICDACGAAQEIHMCTIPEALDQQAQKGGFRVQSWNVELHGRCDVCVE